jgi:hypothetical protein
VEGTLRAPAPVRKAIRGTTTASACHAPLRLAANTPGFHAFPKAVRSCRRRDEAIPS